MLADLSLAIPSLPLSIASLFLETGQVIIMQFSMPLWFVSDPEPSRNGRFLITHFGNPDATLSQ